jgi:uncharacterized protein (TIGR03435 family)
LDYDLYMTRRELLGAAGSGGPLAIGLLLPHRNRAQSQTAAALSFEVTSVKPSDLPFLQIAPQRSGARVTWTTDLTYLITYAYNMPSWRVSGAIPGSDHIYAVDATAAPGATESQVRLMFQSLLTDRFQMAAHRVTKEVDGYGLTLGKGGLKIKEAKPEDNPAAMPEWFATRRVPAADIEGKVVTTIESAGVAAIAGRRVTMAQLAEALQRVLRIAVIDETGLSGRYYFGLEYAQGDNPANTDVPPLFTAIQESLGVRMEKRKTAVEMLVVDHIEKTPTEN